MSKNAFTITIHSHARSLLQATVVETPTPSASTTTKSMARHIITVINETSYHKDNQRECKNSLAENQTPPKTIAEALRRTSSQQL